MASSLGAWAGSSRRNGHRIQASLPLLRVDPAQRPRLEEIRDNLTDRIAEAEREGWMGEAEGLRVSLTATDGKLAQLDERARRATTINLGIPTNREIAGRTATLPTRGSR